MSTFIKKVYRMLQILFSILTATLIILVIILLIYSPGEPEPITDKKGKPLAGSVSEKTFVNIGGVQQGMFIIGKNVNNPVLLYVHGGPSFPNYFLMDKYKPRLEEHFTVCYWEQRGGGLSYWSGLPIETLNFEQLTKDAVEVTRYLCERFRKDKIYIMAHSGGTPIAIQAVARYPQLYHAYIGMAQITDQAESERIAYRYMVEQYTSRGNVKALAELKKFPILDTDTSFSDFYKSLVRDKVMHDLGIGTMHNMKSVFNGVFLPVWTCKAYTLKEKINIWDSKFNFIKKARFIDELFSMNIPSDFPELDIPVYFFSGRYDMTVNIELARNYLTDLRAPLKGFYTFKQSAHSPLFEEPERVREIIVKDVLNGTNKLAD